MTQKGNEKMRKQTLIAISTLFVVVSMLAAAQQNRAGVLGEQPSKTDRQGLEFQPNSPSSGAIGQHEAAHAPKSCNAAQAVKSTGDCPEGTRSCGSSCCGPKEVCCNGANGNYCDSGRCPSVNSDVPFHPISMSLRNAVEALGSE